MKVPVILQKSAYFWAGTVASFVVVGTVYAMVAIPPACSTPGDCDQLDPGFQSATLEGDLTLADDDASHTVGLSAPATILANLIFNLPAADGTAGQTLKTDGAGNLSFNQVSKRVGEFVHAKTDASKTAANGYLAVTGGATYTNGALDYPVWAAMYPEFVTGNDIVFAANVNGMFLRNLGGNALAEGTPQDDATARPTNSFTTNSDSHEHDLEGTYRYVLRVSGSDTSDGQDGDGAGEPDVVNVAVGNTDSDAHSHTITGGGDVETRPLNYAYQLYTIVDTY